MGVALPETLRDRGTLLTGAALLIVTVGAWAGVIFQVANGGMGSMDRAAGSIEMGGEMSRPILAGLPIFVLAWLVMMVAMMLPSALPMVLLYRTVARGQATRGRATAPTWVFVAGYLLVWGLFGIPVYAASLVVDAATVTESMFMAGIPYAVAAVLLAAGVYQFTPLKRVCLRKCRGPLGFLMERWRDGVRGALRLSIEHGAYCVGCCWGLMVVLVAAGSMGLGWVTLIALIVFAEKLLPRGELTARLVGVGLAALGVIVAINPAFTMVLRP